MNPTKLFCFLSLILCTGANEIAFGQNPQPPTTPGPQVPTPPPAQVNVPTGTSSSTGKSASTPGADAPVNRWVRKFSAGLSGHYMPLEFVKGTVTNEKIASVPPLEINTSATGDSSRWGAGVIVQFTVTSRWAVAVGGAFRRGGYTMITDRASGTDNPNTGGDERKHTTINEDTRATFWDIPVLARRYSLPHTKAGLRYFFEGGATARIANHVRTSAQVIDPDGAVTCCSASPAAYKKMVPGATAGIGFQYVDDFGIRVVPEARYTRWFSGTFANQGAQSNRDQVEVVLSITF